MKEFTVFDTQIQNEALINEFKGNIFEFLVGQEIARNFNLENHYLTHLSEDFFSQLKSYEKWLRQNDPNLLKKLPLLAQNLAKEISMEYEAIDKIYLIGKVAGGSQNQNWNEADLVIISNDKEFPVSLKLCRDRSFVNTKSGGVKSFLNKYFCQFEDSSNDQLKLNDIVEKSFHRMGHELYEIAGIENYDSFGPNWEEKNLSHLPGQLPENMKETLYAYYYEVARVLYTQIKKYFEANSELFIQSLLPVVGLSCREMVQWTLFHKDEKKSLYEFSRIHRLGVKQFLMGTSLIEFMEIKENLSSFEMVLADMRIQIRVKPMNRFTTPALKINCSLKF